MIDLLYKNTELKDFLRNEIEENSVRVILHHDYYKPCGTINSEFAVNISVDSYYNSLCLAVTPPSVDNLVVINRGKNTVGIYIVELKDVRRLCSIDFQNIKEKFKTTREDFIGVRFKNEFDFKLYRVSELKLWLVCNKFNFLKHDIDQIKYQKRINGSLMERILLEKPIKFEGIIAKIEIIPSESFIN